VKRARNMEAMRRAEAIIKRSIDRDRRKTAARRK
jgi:hypothetical protein